MADIKRLLNKKGWTGQEMGIIELTNMALNFQQRLRGEEPKDLVDRATFQKMLNGITDIEQRRIYSGYVSIHEWLSLHYNIAQTQLQQAQLQFRTLEGYIERTTLAETVYNYIAGLPIIMTQKQYDTFRENRIKAQFYDEQGRARYSNVFDMVNRAISYYLRQLQQEPKKANPLKAIRKKYLSQPVSSPIILSRWNEINEEGYYTLPDGRRSDKMTDKEWRAAIENTPAMREALENGIAYERLIERAKVLFSGGTEEDADRAQHERESNRGLSVPAIWHYYEDPPKDLTKWDVIERDILSEFYPANIINGEWDEHIIHNFIASMEDFVSEFKDLVEIILKDIDSRYFDGKSNFPSLSTKDWTICCDHRQLYERDFYSMREEIEADTSIFDGNRRALENGIAIIRPSSLFPKSPRIDESGNYVEPDLSKTLSTFTIEAFLPGVEDFEENLETVADARETLLDSYYFVKGYNLAIEMIAEYYDVPKLTVFKMNLAGLEDCIDSLNNLVPVLYHKISQTDYKDKELQHNKLYVLKHIFEEIDYKAIETPAEAIEQARELFQNFKAFNEDMEDSLSTILCIRQPQGTEGRGA